MIEVDLRRYGNDDNYAKKINDFFKDYRGCHNCANHDHGNPLVMCPEGEKVGYVSKRCPLWVHEV